MNAETTPEEIFQTAKKNKHKYSTATEAFTAAHRDLVVYNMSLKKDYVEDYDYVNFRRGLAYVEEIVDFKNSALMVARKGLRKFKDLMPEYLEIKQSHITSSKYHSGSKKRLFHNLQKSPSSSFVIYNSEKLNGQNAQVSYLLNHIWVIGSKNKTLLVADQSELQTIKNKHEHKLTLFIARAWFQLLKTKSAEQIQGIKAELSTNTLVGQYCNSQNLQHLVHYGKQPKLFFYALVEKNNLVDDCQPTSVAIKFLEKYDLPKAKYQITQTKTYEQTLEQLKKIVIKMNELTLKQGGEGSVVYVSGLDESGEHNLLICKVKTIEYRILRKLREKLKDYLKKFNKSFDNLLKKYTKEIQEISREFNLHKPLEYYVELGRKAFSLCEEQTKPVSRFISNRYIDFLRLLEKDTPKQRFMEIVNSKVYEIEEDDENEDANEEKQKIQNADQPQKTQKLAQEKEEPKKQQVIKRVIVLIPVTMPSTGKTCLFQVIKKMNPDFRVWSISSDEIKNNLMTEMMKKRKNMTKAEAFEKCRTSGVKQYFREMDQTFKLISAAEQPNHVFIFDKNHPENALKETNKLLQQKSIECPNMRIVILALLPECLERMQEKGQYSYPFSAAYMLTCLKRVLQRPEHLTLEGSDQDRCKIVFAFANLFRNYSLNPYNLQKYFNYKITFIFNNEKCLNLEKDQVLYGLFKEILLKGKPGDFKTVHSKMERFIECLRQWKLNQIPLEQTAKDALVKLESIFCNFEKQNFSNENDKKEAQIE